jgi:hypothetical protein
MIKQVIRLHSVEWLRLLQRVGIVMLWCSLAGWATAAEAQRQTILVVGVADASTGAPIPDADVFLPALAHHVRTDALGEARVPALQPGVYEIMVRKVGFAAADIRALIRGDSSGVTFMLEKTVVALDTVRVRENAMRARQAHADFEARRRMGLGRFLGPEELANEQIRDFPIVAVSHFPGLLLVTGSGGQLQLASAHGSCGVDTTHEAIAKSRMTGLALLAQQAQQVGGAGSGAREQMSETATSPGSCFSAQPCHVKLFLDDLPVAETDINVVHTQELYGVEYYSSGNAPPRYRTAGAACGVLLLWSKSNGDG